MVLSILCSVTVSVLLKVAPRGRVDLRQAIGFSYLVALILAFGLLGPAPAGAVWSAGVSAGWWSMLALGLLLPGMFLVLARSVAGAGIARTDAAQRLSLLLPLVAAFTVFGEVLTFAKAMGVLLGLGAMVLLVMQRGAQVGAGRGPMLLVAVFAGMGVIDVLFKVVAQATDLPFAGILRGVFAEAFVLSLFYIGWLFARGAARWSWRTAGMAVFLGAFNFGNILFYLKAHRALADNPALVFSAMNIGVVVVAAIVGTLLFRETLGRQNIAGIGLAVLAVAILAYG